MATARQETDIELERLTAVRERHLVGRGDDHDRIHLCSHACPDLSGAPSPRT
jgi:hypothetical protein